MTVLVTTLRGLKMHGGLTEGNIHVSRNVKHWWQVSLNLDRHVENMQRFGQPGSSDP